jgi:hypothetical protein
MLACYRAAMADRHLGVRVTDARYETVRDTAYRRRVSHRSVVEEALDAWRALMYVATGGTTPLVVNGEEFPAARLCFAERDGMLCDRRYLHDGDHVDIAGPLPGHTWSDNDPDDAPRLTRAARGRLEQHNTDNQPKGLQSAQTSIDGQRAHGRLDQTTASDGRSASGGVPTDRDPLGAPQGAAGRAREASEALPTVGEWPDWRDASEGSADESPT